ncbi:MAG: T9SS type A sorting domain-containing protein [Bacteroidota bacterium]
MKKYLYIFIGLFAFAVTSAQTISLNPKVIAKGAPNAEDINGNYNIESQSKITNNATDAADSMFTWTVLELTQPNTWQLDFCDPAYCRTDAKQGENFDFKLRKGESGFMKADFYFKNVSGNGTAKVSIVCKTNPTNADTLTINVNSWITGVNEVSKTKTVAAFPNPVKDQLTVKFSTKDDITVEVYNVLGTRVKTFVHSGMNSQTNVGDLQNGVYFLRFTENGKLYTKQFTKAE